MTASVRRGRQSSSGRSPADVTACRAVRSGAAFDFRSIVTTPAGRTIAPGEHVRLDDVWQFRVISDLLVEQRGPWCDAGSRASTRKLENGAANDSRVRWVSLGARPVRQLGRFFSLATEAGWDYTVKATCQGARS